MPRSEITTTFNTRTKPSTSYFKPRGATDFLWTADKLPWEVTFFPWQFQGSGLATVFNTRTKPITDYNIPRGSDNFLWSVTTLPWEVTIFPWQLEGASMTTVFNTKRKEALLETESGLNFELENGNRLNREGSGNDNIINTTRV